MPTTEALKQLLDIVFDYKVVITWKRDTRMILGITEYAGDWFVVKAFSFIDFFSWSPPKQHVVM